MLVVQKIERSGKFFQASLPKDGNLIDALNQQGKTVLYVETEVGDNVEVTESAVGKFGLFATGEAIPDGAEYFRTLVDEDYQVWHLYVLEIVR